MIGDHPLGIIVAASRYRLEGMPLDRLLQRLQDETTRLHSLSPTYGPDLQPGIVASFNVTHGLLNSDQEQMFAYLSAMFGDTSIDLLSKVLDISALECEDRVGTLITSSLVDRAGDILRMHPLVRDWGRSLVEDLSRLRIVVGSTLFLYGIQLSDSTQDHDWAELELPNITGFIQHFAAGANADTWLIAVGLSKAIADKGRVLDRYEHRSLRLKIAEVALQLASQLGDPRMIAETGVLLAQVLAAENRPNAAEPLLRQSRGIYVDLENKSSQVSIDLELGNLMAATGRVVQARELYNSVVAYEVEENSPADVARLAAATGQLGMIERRELNIEKARDLYKNALDLYLSVDNTEGMAACLFNLGEIEARLGNIQAARQMHLESLSLERRIGSLRGVLVSLSTLTTLSRDSTELEEIRRNCEEILDDLRRRGNEHGESSVRLQLGGIATLQGNLAQAEEHFDRSLHLSRKLGDRRGVAVSLGSLASVAMTQEQWESARKHAIESADTYMGLGDRDGYARCSVQLAKIERVAGNRASAIDNYLHAIEHWAHLRSLDMLFTVFSEFATYMHQSSPTELEPGSPEHNPVTE